MLISKSLPSSMPLTATTLCAVNVVSRQQHSLVRGFTETEGRCTTHHVVCGEARDQNRSPWQRARASASRFGAFEGGKIVLV